MAKFFPEFENIKNLKQAPTTGELHALEILKGLSDDYEVYFQPFINGHNPDIVIIRKNYGATIIEVKDWQLKNYKICGKDDWILRKENIPIQSPIKQVKTYKDDLYDFSISSLHHKNISEHKHYGIVRIAVYFHNENPKSIKENNVRIDKFCPTYGRDDFTLSAIRKYSLMSSKNPLFDDEIYQEFQRVLKPSFHTLEQSQQVVLSKKQQQLVVSQSKQQKVRGVAGSGKTLVLAQRAANSHARHGEKVLILTFNITLRNYIHDNLNRVRQEFHWSNFYITHYHAFIHSQANNHNLKNVGSSGIELFEPVKNKIIKYSAIFIDEVQDYKEEWLRGLKKYFLKGGGEFVVFGDEKQNIYDRQLDGEKKPNTTIPGRWSNLDESFRLSNKILQLAEDFQDEFFKEKYELDKATPKQEEIEFGNIEYHKLNDSHTIAELSDFISYKSKESKIQPQDICILAHANHLLRELDFEIRDSTKQKTYTTFETQEMYNLLKSKKSKLKLEIDIRKIRRNKRFNFWMNSAGMKLSTAHSFKGWEIDTLFLIVDDKSVHETKEMIYTALTRCRSKLFILNIDNDEYDAFFSKKIQIEAKKSVPRKSQESGKQKTTEKTIGKTIQEDNISNAWYKFSELKKQRKI